MGRELNHRSANYSEVTWKTYTKENQIIKDPKTGLKSNKGKKIKLLLNDLIKNRVALKQQRQKYFFTEWKDSNVTLENSHPIQK